MSYLTEFSLDWRPEFHPIPDEVLALVATEEAVDMSWHNDVCPSFGIELKDGGPALRLWVDAVSVNDRECGNETRFWVGIDGENDVLLATDDVAAAVACYRENLPKYRANVQTVQKRHEALTAEYNAWLLQNTNVPKVSADEAVWDKNITHEQAVWLSAFCVIWEAVQ